MAGTFPPDYFAPDYFAPEYFGGEADANAMVAAIAGSASVTATLSVATAEDQDYDSHWHYARTKRKQRAAKTKPKAVPVVPGVLVAKVSARIEARASVVALGEAPRVCWPCFIAADVRGASRLEAVIEGPDRIEEQDWQDLEDLVDLYEVLLAA